MKVREKCGNIFFKSQKKILTRYIKFCHLIAPTVSIFYCGSNKTVR